MVDRIGSNTANRVSKYHANNDWWKGTSFKKELGYDLPVTGNLLRTTAVWGKLKKRDPSVSNILVL